MRLLHFFAAFVSFATLICGRPLGSLWARGLKQESKVGRLYDMIPQLRSEYMVLLQEESGIDKWTWYARSVSELGVSPAELQAGELYLERLRVCTDLALRHPNDKGWLQAVRDYINAPPATGNAEADAIYIKHFMQEGPYFYPASFPKFDPNYPPQAAVPEIVQLWRSRGYHNYSPLDIAHEFYPMRNTLGADCLQCIENNVGAEIPTDTLVAQIDQEVRLAQEGESTTREALQGLEEIMTEVHFP